ncbi:MAG TPA: hypothetical protein VFG21_02355 [Xanthomonadaceae bacterium]|nr:hypothetical protein [Xanthomonadaceae bacterium]
MSTRPVPQGEFQELIDHRDEWCVSIYMPTHRVGEQIRQDRIRLKNLLGQAEKALAARGMRGPDARDILAPARRHLDDERYWQHSSQGLAIFLSPTGSREYALPLDFEPHVVVDDHYEVKPLLPMLLGDGHFFILALSKNKVRLLGATRHSVDEIHVPDLPADLSQALAQDVPERSLQFHTGTPAPAVGGGERAAVFHGQGAGDDTRAKVDLLRYFRLVDRALHKVLHEESAPLVLAAVEYEQAIYRDANSYSHLLEKGIDGSPDRETADALRKRAWPLVEPSFRAAELQAVARYRELSATDRATTDVTGIVPAAWWGRVDTLFLERNRHLWGSFDPDTNSVKIRGEGRRRDGEFDLFELAVQRTLARGGAVYAVESDRMPVRAPLAAVLRY